MKNNRLKVLIQAISERQQCYLWALFIYCCISNFIFSPIKKFKSFESQKHASDWLWECLFFKVPEHLRPVQCYELLAPKSFGVIFYCLLFIHLCLVPFGMIGKLLKVLSSRDVRESINTRESIVGQVYKRSVLSKSYLYLEAYLDNLSFCTTSSNWHAMVEDFTDKEVEFFLDLWNVNTLLLYISNGWAKSISMSLFFSSVSKSVMQTGSYASIGAHGTNVPLPSGFFSASTSVQGCMFSKASDELLSLKECQNARRIGRLNWFYGQYDCFELDKENFLVPIISSNSCELPKIKNKSTFSKNIKADSIFKQIKLNLGLFFLFVPFQTLLKSAFWQLNFIYFILKFLKKLKSSILLFGLSLTFIVSYYAILSSNLLSDVYVGKFNGFLFDNMDGASLVNVFVFLLNLLFSDFNSSTNILIRNDLFVQKFPELMLIFVVSFIGFISCVILKNQCLKYLYRIGTKYLSLEEFYKLNNDVKKNDTFLKGKNNTLFECDSTVSSGVNNKQSVQLEDSFFLMTQMNEHEYRSLAFDAMMTSADFNGNSYSFILNANLGAQSLESAMAVSHLLRYGLVKDELFCATMVLKRLEEITLIAVSNCNENSLGQSFSNALNVAVFKQQQKFNNYYIKYIQYNLIEEIVNKSTETKINHLKNVASTNEMAPCISETIKKPKSWL